MKSIYLLIVGALAGVVFADLLNQMGAIIILGLTINWSYLVFVSVLSLVPLYKLARCLWNKFRKWLLDELTRP